MSYPRILFFIAGTAPTLQQQLEADALAPCRVSYRNTNFISKGTNLEACDGYYGADTPKAYKDEYPTAEEAVKAFVAKRDADYKAKQDKVKAQKQAKAETNAMEADKQANKAAVAKEKADANANAKAIIAADAKAKAEAAKKAAPTAEPDAAAVKAAAASWTNNADAN